MGCTDGNVGQETSRGHQSSTSVPGGSSGLSQVSRHQMFDWQGSVCTQERSANCACLYKMIRKPFPAVALSTRFVMCSYAAGEGWLANHAALEGKSPGMTAGTHCDDVAAT